MPARLRTGMTRKSMCLSISFCMAALSACSTSSDTTPQMSAIDGFEVQQYLGNWHQIAAVPAWFQKDCVARVTADYAALDNGQVEVVNSCDRKEKARQTATGRARFQETRDIGKLDVTFVDILGAWVWPIGGNYWIIALDADYQWSVVGEPSRKYGWILSRTDTLEIETLGQILAILEQEKYDPCEFIMSTPTQQGRLCDLWPAQLPLR